MKILNVAKIALLFVLITLVFSNIDLINYLWMQGNGQFEVLWNSQKIDTFLENKQVDESYKQKIHLVDSIKTFASSQLGMNADGLYTSIYDQKGEDILWNLSACKPFAIDAVEWSFPIVGKVSYKGFFDLEKGKQAQERLKMKGYDTRLRSVNAWSTLGWFNDPILSNMLNRSQGDIAELFLHEITHSNIFIEDSLSFNENLASFIGEQGARLFLISNYGIDSPQYLDYINKEYDSDLFTKHCLSGLLGLEGLYSKFELNMSDSSKQGAKDEFMQQWVYNIDTLQFSQKGRYANTFSDKLPNNAFFMAFRRYSSKKEGFKDELNERFDGDLNDFVQYYMSSNN